MSNKGFSFPTKFGFSGSTGKVSQVRGHTRKMPKKAGGGMMTPNLVRGAGLSQARAGLAPPQRPIKSVPLRAAPPTHVGFDPRLERGITPPGKISGARLPQLQGRVVGAAPNRNQMYRGPLGRAYADGGYVKTRKPISDVMIGDQGNPVTRRGNPSMAEADKEFGGKGPLRTGYKKGGKAKRKYAEGGGVSATKAREIAHDVVGMHVNKPAPKGHKGFERMPMFGKNK